MLRIYKELESVEVTKAIKDDLPPARRQKRYVTESGDFPDTPILISLAADESIDDEVIQVLADNLYCSCSVFEAREEPAAGKRAELVDLLEQAAALIGDNWDPAPRRYPDGAIAGHVMDALELARLWSSDADVPAEDDPVPGDENIIFISLQLDTPTSDEIPRPYEVAFHFDPWIAAGDTPHAYDTPGSPDILTTVACSEGRVAPDLTGDGIMMGVRHASPGSSVSLRSGRSDARLYIDGEANRSYYTVTGRIRVD